MCGGMEILTATAVYNITTIQMCQNEGKDVQ
jgi:hypothetical protein